MNKQATLHETGEQGGVAPHARVAPFTRSAASQGLVHTARFAGKAVRALRDSMNAKGTMLARPLRKREAPLASRASRRIREGQKRIKALGRELETLKTRLGECLARNTMEGKINPAEDPEVQDITWDIEKKSGTLRELQDMLKSLETTVTLLRERLAPAADKASAASPVCEEPHGSLKETAETPPTREPGTEGRRVVVPEAAPAGPAEGEKPEAKAAEKADEVVKKESGGA